MSVAGARTAFVAAAKHHAGPMTVTALEKKKTEVIGLKARLTQEIQIELFHLFALELVGEALSLELVEFNRSRDEIERATHSMEIVRLRGLIARSVRQVDMDRNG
jgi:hypothetical protein